MPARSKQDRNSHQQLDGLHERVERREEWESVDGGAKGGWRRWWVAPVGEWLWSVGGVAIGLRWSVGGATMFWERKLRGREETARKGENRQPESCWVRVREKS